MKRFLLSLLLLFLLSIVWGQTNPSAQTIPYSQDFGTSTFTTMPTGWAAWNGLSGATINTQALAEASSPSGDATITAATSAQTIGGVYGYATASNARPYIQTSSNSANGVDQLVLAINTTSFGSITVAYDVEIISAQPKTVGIVMQYRSGTTGSWTTVSATGNPYSQAGGTTGVKVNVSLTLPSGADNQSVVQLRWAVWRGTEAGNSSGVAIDNINISGTPGTFNSNNSNIITNTGFSTPTNIDYTLYQGTTLNTSNSVEVAQFTIQDGGGVADADALSTTLTGITFSLTNSAYIRRVALFDGTTNLAEVAGGSSVTFSSLSVVAPDDGSKTFSVRVSFNSVVTDNQQFVFTITSATADPTGSTFALGNAGGAVSGSAGDENRIEVTADRLAYVQNTTSPTGMGVAMSPAVTVSANDVFGNRDLDFTLPIRITSTGTLLGTPVIVSATSGVATFPAITHTALGSGLTLNAERDGTLDWDITSDPFDILTPSSSTDYFRSLSTGNWNAAATWQSSPDDITYQPATISPDFNSAKIYIRNTHTVTLTSSVTADDIEIQSGGILVNNMASSNTLTLNNGAALYDMVIKPGGMYQITSGNGYSGYQTVNAGAIVHIENNGVIRIGAGGVLGGSSQNSFATTSATYIWDNGSVFDWNTTSIPGATGVTFFPDATAGIIPIWRFTASPGSAMGGATALIVNGVLEANSAVSFVGTSDKTFRNGITGTSNVTLNAGVGKLIINGTTATLSGTGTIIPNSNGLEIGSASNATTVSVTSNKTVTGNISLLSTNNTYVDLGANNLTVTGTISGGATNAFIKTSSTGALTLSAIAPTAFKIFPIGKSSYNPLQITNNDAVTTADFTARVEDVINPGVSVPSYGISRTWNINASSAISNADITFQYATADAGINALPPQNMEVLLYSGSAWSIITGQTGIVTGGADPAWTINTNLTGIPIATSATPYILGINGGWILPVDYIISTRAQKINNTGIINWSVNSCSDVTSFEVQRSVGNSGFRTIGTVTPSANQTDFSFTDGSLATGTNLYRIKVNRAGGAAKYSNTVALIYNSNDIFITSLAPNPVHSSAVLTVSTAKSTRVDFKVFDMSGHVVRQWQSNIAEGNNIITINADGLAAGVYHILASSNEAKAFTRFIKQ